MAYLLRAFIARFNALESFVIGQQSFELIPLPQAFAMMLNEALIDQGNGGQNEQLEINRGFAHLTSQLISGVVAVSHSAPIAYIENECFGGLCDQYAIAWQAGVVIYGPELVEGRIGNVSAVLRMLGVEKAESDVDECEALGLSRFRNHAAWLKYYADLDSTDSC